MSADSIRRRILERRALFIGSALAGLGCGPSGAPPTSPPPVVGVEPTQQSPSATPADGSAGPRPAPTAKPDKPPAIVIPAGVSGRARQSYDALTKTMGQVHQLLGEAESLLPDSCDILDPACEDKWSEVASRLSELRRVHTFSYFCPGASEEAKQFAAVHAAQRELEQRRTGKLQARIDKALARSGPAAAERWEELKRKAYEAKPYPCLSIACDDW